MQDLTLRVHVYAFACHFSTVTDLFASFHLLFSIPNNEQQTKKAVYKYI